MSRNEAPILKNVSEEYEQKIKLENKRSFILQLMPIFILVALFIVFTIIEPKFITFNNIRNILNQLAVPLILSIGLTFVVLIGSIDLSVEGVMGFAATLMATLVSNNKNPNDFGLFGVLIAILACGVIGLLLGVVFVKAKVPSFMLSFAFGSIATGIALLVNQRDQPTIKYALIKDIITSDFLGIIPTTFIIAATIFIIALILQKYTSWGVYLYAVGENEDIPRIAGVNINKVKIIAFVFCALCAGIAGVITAAKLGQGNIMTGQNQLFPALTAVVIGGTYLSGGKGGVVNTLIGATIVVTLQNGLLMMGVDSTIQQGIQGAIIILAVILSVNRRQVMIYK